MAIEFRKYDPATGSNYREELKAEDMPGILATNVAEFNGHVTFPIANPGFPGWSTATQITHAATIFTPRYVPALSPILLSPTFRFIPGVAGLYKVHHRRRDYLYNSTGVQYEWRLQLGSTATGIITVAQHPVRVGGPGGTAGYDDVDISGERVVWCNGTTDEILIKVSHNDNATINVGPPIGILSETHTTIYRVGSIPESAS